MDTIAELLEAIDSQGWKVLTSAHTRLRCPRCLYAALNGISLAKYDQYTNTGYTGPGNHWATIARKDT